MTTIIAVVSGKRSNPITPRRPSWKNLEKFYPNTSISTSELYNIIGGGLPEYLKLDPIYWENSCCIRMSRGLNYSGMVLPEAPSKGGTIYGRDKKGIGLELKI